MGLTLYGCYRKLIVTCALWLNLKIGSFPAMNKPGIRKSKVMINTDGLIPLKDTFGVEKYLTNIVTKRFVMH